MEYFGNDVYSLECFYFLHKHYNFFLSQETDPNKIKQMQQNPISNKDSIFFKMEITPFEGIRDGKERYAYGFLLHNDLQKE